MDVLTIPTGRALLRQIFDTTSRARGVHFFGEFLDL